MKKIFYAFLTLGTTAFVFSCKKDHNEITKQVVIDTTLNSGSVFNLSLGQYGDKDDTASIIKQATNFTTSQINNSTGIFEPVYQYSSFNKTGTADQVILSVKEGHREGKGNGRQDGDSTVITINFTIK